MVDQIFIHPFEKAGLGLAPFRFVGHEVILFQVPGQTPRAGGSCDYCGTGIRDAFIIFSADGKRFKVGCDCVRKVESKGTRLLSDIEAVAKKVAKERKAATLATREIKAWATLEANPELFTDRPHPSDWFAAKGLTLRNSIIFLLDKGGASGRTKACLAIEREAA